MYELIKKDGRAKRGRLTTVHGVIETPVFMNVGTVAAIKGAVSTDDLKDIGTQVELSNTYHLHVRTGDKLIKEFGGLHKFMHWDRPILTDSGGFQVFSLAKLRKIKEEGVSFASHIDGRKIFMGKSGFLNLFARHISWKFHAETSFAVEGDSVSKRVFFQVFFVVDRPFGIAYGSIVTAGMP